MIMLQVDEEHLTNHLKTPTPHAFWNEIAGEGATNTHNLVLSSSYHQVIKLASFKFPQTHPMS